MWHGCFVLLWEAVHTHILKYVLCPIEAPLPLPAPHSLCFQVFALWKAQTVGLQLDFYRQAGIQAADGETSVWNQCAVDGLLLPPDPFCTQDSEHNLNTTSQKNHVRVPKSEPLPSRPLGNQMAKEGNTALM